MSIAKILVPVRGDGKGENVLAHAAAIARRHNAHIEAMHCRARPEDMIPHGLAVPTALRKQMQAQVVELANAEEASLQELFSELMGRLGLDLIEAGVPPRDRPSVGYNPRPARARQPSDGECRGLQRGVGYHFESNQEMGFERRRARNCGCEQGCQDEEEAPEAGVSRNKIG